VSGRKHRARRVALTILAASAAAGLSLSGVQPQAAAAPRHTTVEKSSGYQTSSSLDRLGTYDSRLGTLKTQLRDARGIVANRGPAFAKFTKRLGNQAVLDFNSATGTPRNLGKLNGFLTGKSSATAKTVALRYVRAHHAVLGLSTRDLKTFRLTRQWTDIAGIRHLSFTQHARGIEVFGNGLRANVTKQGRLISLQGSPVSGLARMAAKTSSAPKLSAAAARSAAARDVGGRATHSRVTRVDKDRSHTWKNHDYARLVWFDTRDGLRLGWSTYVQAGGDDLDYQHVIDAQTGATLYRHDTLNNDNGDARVFENHPGAPVGGTQHVVNLFKAGFLPKNAKNLLDGSYVAAWSDYNDNDQPGSNELVPVPGTPTGSQFKFTPFPGVDPLCSRLDVCSWDPNTANSWRTNRRADVLQGFYFDSRFHNYLMHKPIGFTPQAGNFEANGDDPVLFNALDGANTDAGLPDANHIDNANMSTPPDGIPPTMQMYLFHFPGTTDDVEPFLPSSSAFDPNVILHEYTHGLSNRLVVDVSGNSTLNSLQAGSMGEAWSDYYAEDYLVTKGLRKDTAKPGQLFLGDYMEPLRTQLLRTEPIDCPVGTDSPKCAPINPALPNGGYTYGDVSAVIGAAEVHASGEIWGQTLWDLRTRLGHIVTDALVTRAMSLAPDDPSFLDMRNSILQADLAVYGGTHRKALWRVFANRGMGFNAGTLDGTDAFPAEDFSMPPKPTTARGTVSGQVVDGVTGEPVAGVLVAIGGHDSGFVGDYTDVTDAGGRYSIPSVLVGSYPLLSVFGPGYEIASTGVDVTADGVTSDFEIRRDWASASGGAFVQDFDGPDFSSAGACGPNNVNDLSQGTAWVTITGNTEAPTGTIVPKAITIKLPQAIQLTDLAVDPTTQCGLGGSASVGDLTVETSPDGTTWTEAATATFDATNRFQYNEVPVSPPIDDVRYVRVTLNGPQVPAPFTDHCPTDPDGIVFSGCTYMVLTEVEAFGPAM
jgi:extracellular elastinolytic metalloproteinase